jgi:hypothetical protein
MGIYSDFLDKNMSFEALTAERKTWLKRISEIRGKRDILVYAVDINKRAPISIDNSDIIPFTDMLSDLNGSSGIDIILQTPGGIADVVERFVSALRDKYDNVGVIIPGMAMSAGTIFTMAADEILMGKTSSLGPIDAQIISGGKQYSADAFLEGLNKIKEEVEKTNKLNPVYIPILQNISPGEIQDNENAQKLSATLVKDWLVKYKFSHWPVHTKTGKPVTEEEKKRRATEIAEELGKHSKWLTHSRPLGIKELRNLKLEIQDYTENPELNEAITKYFILLSMTFDISSVYKIYETPDKQIMKFATPPHDIIPNSIDLQKEKPHSVVQIKYTCPNCKMPINIQGNFDAETPIAQGFIKFPENNILECPNCKTHNNLQKIRMDIEGQFKQKLI